MVMDDGGGEQECLSIAATVFDGVRRWLGVRWWPMFDGGQRLTTTAAGCDSGCGCLTAARTAMAGAVDNEDRVTTAAAMYEGEASAEDYGDRVEDVMGGSGSGGRGRRGLDKDDDDNDGDGSSDDEQQRQQRRQLRQRQ